MKTVLPLLLFATIFFIACNKNADSNSPQTINLSGVWKMDLTLGEGVCDETLLEDEAHVPPTFHFNNDGTITFDTDPTEEELNGEGYTNTYTLSGDTLTVSSHYQDDLDNILLFTAVLLYNKAEDRFSGTYTNRWDGGEACTNDLVIEK